MNRLLTIRVSHYNEKARWALDRLRFSTPVLVTDDRVAICDSSRIMRWANVNHAGPGNDLFPTAVCDALEARFSQGLGEHARRLAYY